MGGLASHPGVDLVEDHGGRSVGEHQAQGQHGPGQLPARGHLGQGQDRLPRVGAQQEA